MHRDYDMTDAKKILCSYVVINIIFITLALQNMPIQYTMNYIAYPVVQLIPILKWFHTDSHWSIVWDIY